MIKKVPVHGNLKEALQRHAPHVGCVHEASVLKEDLVSKVVLVSAPDLPNFKSIVVKYGYNIESLNRETGSMRLVATETSVPIPKLLGTHVAQDEDGDPIMFIVMEQVPGSTL